MKTEKAAFACGCFWHVEAAFKKIKGVISTRVGYSGGSKENPTYEDVCSSTTGHAEAVEVVFDPTIVSYEKLLGVFWSIHDPTQVNRQGPDVGTQYRSAIFYHSRAQEKEAVASKENLEKSRKYTKPVATEISPVKKFYPAEEYHQGYFAKHPKKRFLCRG